MSKLKKKMLTLQSQVESMGYTISNLKNSTYKTCNYDFKNMLVETDVSQYISRFKWEGLPDYLPTNIIERMLYFHGAICGFFYKGQVYFLPFAIKGGLNTYGYPTSLQPIGYNGQVFNNLTLNTYPNGMLRKYAETCILTDRTPNLNGMCQPMASINSDILDLMNDTLKRSELSSISSNKKFLVNLENGQNAETTKNLLRKSLLDDDCFILAKSDSLLSNGLKSTQFVGTQNETDKIMQYFSSLNNLRCYNLGIKNNGVFEKMERVVTGELTGNEYQTNLILETGLQIRKEFIENLKKLYPEESSTLSKIKVSINVEPYKAKGDTDIESNFFDEREGTTKVGVENEIR